MYFQCSMNHLNTVDVQISLMANLVLSVTLYGIYCSEIRKEQGICTSRKWWLKKQWLTDEETHVHQHLTDIWLAKSKKRIARC